MADQTKLRGVVKQVWLQVLHRFLSMSWSIGMIYLANSEHSQCLLLYNDI